MKYTCFVLILAAMILTECTSTQINHTIGGINDVLDTQAPLSTAEVGEGLKEALIKGVSTGSERLSQLDGYFGNPEIKIPFPRELGKVEDKLRQVGLGKEVDKFILALNRGAEEAAKEAKPIFVTAIRSLSIQDAWGILNGGTDAATQFLKTTTSVALKDKFKPVIQNSLRKVNATRYYKDVVNAYNKIPFTEDVNPNLDDYATDMAVEGLFIMIAKEEKAIREDPVARTTEILRKVFGAQN